MGLGSQDGEHGNQRGRLETDVTFQGLGRQPAADRPQSRRKTPNKLPINLETNRRRLDIFTFINDKARNKHERNSYHLSDTDDHRHPAISEASLHSSVLISFLPVPYPPSFPEGSHTAQASLQLSI